jgi:hypothetical protein
MDQAAVFLAGSILIALGFVVVVAASVAINNILHKYWKPVRFFTSDSFNMGPPTRYMTDEEYRKHQEPKMEQSNGKSS